MYAPPWVSPGQTKLEDVGAELVNSWAKGVQQKLLSQQHEEAIRKLDLAIQNQENLQDYRNKMLGIDQQRMDEAHEDRQDAIQIRRDNFNERKELKDTIREQQGNLNEGLAGLDLNDPDAYSKVLDLEAENSDGAMTTAWNSKRNAFFNRYNNNANKANTAFNTGYRTWLQEQGRLYRDFPGDMSSILNKNAWQQQYAVYDSNDKIATKDDGTPYYVDPNNPALYPTLKEGQYVGPTENVYVPWTDTKSGTTQYYTRPASAVAQTRKEYADWQKRKAALPQQISAPGHGVYPQSSPYGAPLDRTELAKRALSDPNAEERYKAAARRQLGLNADGSEDDTVNANDSTIDFGE